MDKDRIKGAAQQAKGNIKKQFGNMTGNPKLAAEGQMEEVEGKLRSAIGGAKDTLRRGRE